MNFQPGMETPARLVKFGCDWVRS